MNNPSLHPLDAIKKLILLLLLPLTLSASAAAETKPLKVFILAGQPNMEGHAVEDLEGKDYNEGRGTLAALMRDPDKAPMFNEDASGLGMKKLLVPAAVRFDPVLRDIEGWKIHVEPALIDGAHREEGAQALTMLANHLQRIKILVPAEPLAKMQTIEIWIEHDHPKLKAMQYHPSKGWLVANGHDPRLTRKVHITQARELLSRSQMLKHPAVVLHELAHGYHDQILSFEHPDILAAYHQARDSGSYTNVLLYTGRRVKHYGITDHKEYFAEGTEAYLYRNDFYPFVRAELKEHDPALHEVLVRIWGPAN